MFTKLFSAALCVIAIDARRARELNDPTNTCEQDCYVKIETEDRYATAELRDTNPDPI